MNPILQALCNVMNLFSTPTIAVIAFIICAVMLITIALTEARGVVGNIIRVVAALAGIAGLKTLITVVLGITFGC
ncbi:hypothetical protein [Burkholderia glumae]|uniref:hypothetical protein n=1 Tax=Burkholderia glumae TaxID=337 RepID=UPI0020366765|nr:hypothetical protein [Burkholderia glumae]MCM2552654.1 hypothetical protein [Burkholderia glumae]MCQ0031484.1 hypothetical protein [Burkholderia glumae]MCQ0035136.1 hypothetical protein [Burkholderia glumae]MCR1769783.1 hypothetical protein [Burkholderia glumae]UVT00078.1 hypothetical protein EFP19_30985 [Burkholderia glumae]